MRKIFTFLCAALMSVGMFATTVVTITQNDFPYPYGSSLTKDGVTVSGDMDGMEGSLIMGGSFSTTLGNFTKIEVTADDVSISGTGWTGNYRKMTWTGNASSVSFSGNIVSNGHGVTLTFTIEEPGSGDSGNPGSSDSGPGSGDSGNPGSSDSGPGSSDSGPGSGDSGNPEPQPAATTVTWDFFFCSEVEALCDDGANIALNNSKDGITVTYSGYDDMDGMDGGGIWLYGGSSSKVIFSSAVGDISKIEVYYYDDPGLTPPDWTVDATNKKFVWEGTPAASVDLMRGTAGNIGFMVDHIVFTIGAAEPTAVENVQTNHVQATKFFRDGQLLIEKNGKIYNVMGAEVK